MAEYDLCVVGGGIHGVGVAQAAAAAGHTVCLLEKSQLAAGTSRWSSKLIHGGLRYLEGLELGLVRESLRERELLLRLAPDLVHRLPLHIPVYPDSRRAPWKIRVGLTLYSLLSGFGEATRYRALPRADWPELDGLTLDGLRAVFVYRDAQTDDAALTRAVMASGIGLGAELRRPARFASATRTDSGYRVSFDADDRTETLTCRVLVNAAGPWIGEVLERVEPAPPPARFSLVRGSHLELPGEIERGGYYVEAPRDGRPVFVLPWKGHTLLGTTERTHEGALERPQPDDGERAYLLETLEHYFPRYFSGGSPPSIENAWAGLRVLAGGDGSLHCRSRETVLWPDDPQAPHLLTIVGGKLTGYRATAERVMQRLRRVLPERERRGRTTELTLSPVAEDALPTVEGTRRS